MMTKKHDDYDAKIKSKFKFVYYLKKNRNSGTYLECLKMFKFSEWWNVMNRIYDVRVIWKWWVNEREYSYHYEIKNQSFDFHSMKNYEEKFQIEIVEEWEREINRVEKNVTIVNHNYLNRIKNFFFTVQKSYVKCHFHCEEILCFRL